eukprot:4572358-Lingulodinium_polyedra.AAC.1
MALMMMMMMGNMTMTMTLKMTMVMTFPFLGTIDPFDGTATTRQQVTTHHAAVCRLSLIHI